MIVPMRKGTSPWWKAARRRIGVPTIAPTNPTPWLIPFATSSPADCVQFRKGSDSSTAFIARDHATHIEGILPNQKWWRSALDVNLSAYCPYRCVRSLYTEHLH